MQKLFGWFGGYGFSGTMGFFTGQMRIPRRFLHFSPSWRRRGSLGLITGLLTRVAALGITINMAVAILTVHLPFGFFMNWSGTQKGEGYEYHLLAIAIGLRSYQGRRDVLGLIARYPRGGAKAARRRDNP